MSDPPTATRLPARYASIRLLGAGGGGEVFAVRDRIDERVLALKALGNGDGNIGSSQHEIAALVREATTLMDLSRSSGMALPRVERFGRLSDGRPYLVRELVDGESLAAFIDQRRPLMGAARALYGATVQLTQLHRAGVLHGDIKPANLIVKPDGTSTLVDLGLATAWGPSGARPEGLTPRYAAPELLQGETLTVRGEVYALGASLRDVLAGCARDGVEGEVVSALVAVVGRATASEPSIRYPSVDEVGAAIAAACSFPEAPAVRRGIWTIVATDGPIASLVTTVEAMTAGEELVVAGPKHAGGRTLMAALAWRLGISGWPVAWLRGPYSEASLSIELATAVGAEEVSIDAAIEHFGSRRGLLVIEDPLGAASVMDRLRASGALIVARRFERPIAAKVFEVARLHDEQALGLVRRALPSLPEAVLTRVVTHGKGLPGRLRAIVEAIADRAIMRAESVDVIVASLDPASNVASATPRNGDDATTIAAAGLQLRNATNLVRARELLDAGRVTEAETVLASTAPSPRGHLLRGWIALAKGDYETARASATAVSDDDLGDSEQQVALLAERAVLRAKLSSRTGAYERAIVEADEALAGGDVRTIAPAVAAEALQARGLARVYRADDAGARADLDDALSLARVAGSLRVEALAHSSLAIAHQRAGRPTDARTSYGRAITAAEEAGDASAVATSRLNLGTLCWQEGDLAAAIDEFEAAADLGRRAQKQSTVERALINLAFVDLQLGRYARVATTLRSLEPLEAQMTTISRAQLLGLRADLTGRMGDIPGAVELYRAAIAGWRSTGRPQDAAEVTIDEVLMRRQRGSTLVATDVDLASLQAATTELGARAAELAVQIGLARGLVKSAQGDDAGALVDLDAAAKAAAEHHANEWRWQVHAARARVLSAQGSHARARRDADEAAAILEEIASKLPRDLREVFWDEPRRRALRQVHEPTVLTPHGSMPPSFLAIPTLPSSSPGLAASGLGAPQAHAGGGQTQFIRLAEDRLARILAVNRDLACETDLERLLARVTDQAIDLLGADRGFVLLADADTDAKDDDDDHSASRLTPRAARDRGKDDPSVQFSRSIAERVLLTGESIVTNNAQGDSRLGAAASIHALAIHSVACVPIPRVRGGDRAPIGVLYLETRGLAGLGTRQGRSPGGMESELPTLLAFADQVGIAIANATLVEENIRRADELALANRELEQARKRLDEALTRRTEQLERAKADLATTRQALRGHAGYAGYKGLVGSSNAMRTLYALVDRVKATDVPVLLTGESGTGKEVVARAIHAGSARSKKPFLGVNCGAIPENLLEGELFGHVRGAFTGADRDRKGLFREAEGGTLLLDEIGEMPLKMQSGLLRVMQERTIRPVGGAREEAVDTRVICATHRDLGEMVAARSFREDLFYRINVVVLRIPPLRERAEDIPLLCDYFLGVFAAHYRRERKAIAREAMRALQEHPWPGNVRQLEHTLLNAFVMSDDALIELDDLSLPERPRAGAKAPLVATPARRDSSAPARSLQSHKNTEKTRILAALEQAGWNRLQAAKLCGIPRRTFYRRLKEFGIQA